MSTRVITVRNVNEALVSGVQYLTNSGVRETSRNGPVLVAPGVVVTEYQCPWERVIFNPVRDANPVFHLMEAIWMIAGKKNVGFLLPFNARFAAYAEDDGHQHGAYGFRWRETFGFDQIERVIHELTVNPESRQAVIQMWSAELDLGAKVRDKPCNTTMVFDRRGDKLNMTVFCRSNDMVLGAYGANAVHMSMLQELIAHALDTRVGTYWQVSHNFHAYTEHPVTARLLAGCLSYDYYEECTVRHVPMISAERGETWQDFVDDCERMVDGGDHEGYACDFMNMADRLRTAYLRRKEEKSYSYLLDSGHYRDVDWVTAFREWVARRA